MPAKLTMMQGPRPNEVQLIEDGLAPILGRSTKSDIFVPDARSSRNHCRIEQVDGRWKLTDLGSLNGTRVNDEQVTETNLADGDVIRIGSVTYRFDVGEAIGSPPSATVGDPNATVQTTAPPPAPAPPPQPSGSAPSPPPLGPGPDALDELDEPLEEESGPLELFPDEDAEIPPPAAVDADAAVCAQCGRSLPTDAVARDEATEIGGRLYCHRCVIQHGGDTGPVESNPDESQEAADVGTLLQSIERASKADRVATGPLPPPAEPPQSRRGGLLDRLRGKSGEDQ
jgi:predicted component of type VI protein secretion system